MDRSRARAPGSMGGDVPEKYYVVRNTDMIRVKYLLVYASKSPAKTHRYISFWSTDLLEIKIMLLLK